MTQVQVEARYTADVYSEQLLCAAAMLHPEDAPRLAVLAQSADFTSPWLQTLWRAIEGCVKRDRAPVVEYVGEVLAHWGKFSQRDEATLFKLLDDMWFYVLVASNHCQRCEAPLKEEVTLEYHARAVHELGERRRAAAAILRGEQPAPSKGWIRQ